MKTSWCFHSSRYRTHSSLFNPANTHTHTHTLSVILQNQFLFSVFLLMVYSTFVNILCHSFICWYVTTHSLFCLCLRLRCSLCLSLVVGVWRKLSLLVCGCYPGYRDEERRDGERERERDARRGSKQAAKKERKKDWRVSFSLSPCYIPFRLICQQNHLSLLSSFSNVISFSLSLTH